MEIKEQTITLTGLRFYAYHGAEPQEAIVGSWSTVSLIMKLESTNAFKSDDLSDTLNYAKAARIVQQQMQIRSNLIEHLAGRIAQALMDGIPHLHNLTITISKENPPVCVPCTSASFTLSISQ